MKPRLRPHPQSEKHHTIPTQVFLDPTAAIDEQQSLARQAAIHALKRKVSLAQEARPACVSLSQHCRAIVWSWWRGHSCHFKRISPLKRFHKLLGKEQTHLHMRQEELRQLYERSASPELLQPWQIQQGSFLVPATVVAPDPIFVVLHQIPRVLVVAGYVGDTAIVGLQNDSQWIAEVFGYIKAWKTAGVVMDVHWFPQRLLVGLCRWLKIGPLLDPAIMHAVSLFGGNLRQGPTSFSEEHEGSYAKQVQQCWAYWQMQLPLEDIQRLLAILRQSDIPAQRAPRFKAYFKQVAISCVLESARAHLVNRIDKNGWALGPSAAFLEWLANTPVSQVGAVPRYAVLRWALGEDADHWLPLRGKISRSQPCIWRKGRTRCFPRGPGYGALCPPCISPASPSDLALGSLRLLRLTMDCSFVWRVRAGGSPVVFQSQKA